ncbi:von Willebrand factor A domain-containing protein 3B-like [Gigantopelta aegis]|uniref:von Willebrand factor A domain-containing protein 3B-like n=1 Tax=Gigantopelta aegis TaxID=1735272 RepID=UPI001B88B1F1|nr:von Willebrand factor A domain-containing protein 3B-like [Gigantopelta aegis]
MHVTVIPLRRKDEDKENIFKLTAQSDCYVLKTLRNQSVIAQNEENGLYYLGVVKSCCTKNHVTVQFTATGTEHVIPSCFIIPISGAIAVPTLKVRDCVLERVFSYGLETDCYVPGIVKYTSYPTEHPTVYTVILYNKQKIRTTRRNLVKISPITYDLTVKHIRLHQSGSDVRYRYLNSKALSEEVEQENTEHEDPKEKQPAINKLAKKHGKPKRAAKRIKQKRGRRKRVATQK